MANSINTDKKKRKLFLKNFEKRNNLKKSIKNKNLTSFKRYTAQIALQKGKSLLAAGVKSIEGSFNKGDQIKIVGKNNQELAIGLSSFSSSEILKIKGKHSNKIQSLLGYVSKSEVVHKDDMVEI